MEKLDSFNEISSVWLDYKDALRNYIFKIVKEEDTANSLAHEVLMKVYSSCCSGTKIINVRSWLFQIAYNTCMDHFKKEKKTMEINFEPHEEKDNLTYKRAEEFIEPLIRLLPEKYAHPLILSDLEGKKQQEVAAILELSLTATKSRIQRARVLLKNQITECVHVEVDKNGNLMAFNVKGTCAPLKEHSKKCDNSASF